MAKSSNDFIENINASSAYISTKQSQEILAEGIQNEQLYQNYLNTN